MKNAFERQKGECIGVGDLEIRIPEEARRLDQNEEWVEVLTEDGIEKIRLHDYARFYEIPGFYDQFYKRLHCQSPRVVCESLKSQIMKSDDRPESLRALDFGAGNGQVGERLADDLGCRVVVGVDIIPQAREAARRDRPEVYDDYYVLDLAHPTREDREKLSRWRFNTLVTVAALGYGDISAKAFVNAFNLLEEGAWIAFNIKDRFLSQTDQTGFNETIHQLLQDSLELIDSKRYCHRISLAGEPLHYYVIVGRKINNITVN